MALFGNGAVQPVVSLPEQEKRTGEEAEQTLFNGALPVAAAVGYRRAASWCLVFFGMCGSILMQDAAPTP
jgi:hypothetical protein